MAGWLVEKPAGHTQCWWLAHCNFMACLCLLAPGMPHQWCATKQRVFASPRCPFQPLPLQASCYGRAFCVLDPTAAGHAAPTLPQDRASRMETVEVARQLRVINALRDPGECLRFCGLGGWVEVGGLGVSNRGGVLASVRASARASLLGCVRRGGYWGCSGVYWGLQSGLGVASCGLPSRLAASRLQFKFGVYRWSHCFSCPSCPNFTSVCCAPLFHH